MWLAVVFVGLAAAALSVCSQEVCWAQEAISDRTVEPQTGPQPEAKIRIEIAPAPQAAPEPAREAEKVEEPPEKEKPEKPEEPADKEKEAKKPVEKPKELKLFGLDFFKTARAEFQPSPDTPVPAEYALGPGDTLEVTFSSGTGEESSARVTIDPRGQARIPNVGLMSARGLRLEEFESRLNRSLRQKYPGLTARVSLQKIRAIQVFVAGEAARPGAYTLSGLSRLFNALYAAGGPSAVGSLRKIQVIRNNNPIAEMDLYEYLLTGRRPGDVVLQSNDTVFIPVIGPTVTLQGEVRRPAIYELRGGEMLSDALRLAGGLAPSAYARRIQVERVDAHEKRVLLDVRAENLSDGNSPEFAVPLRSGDTISVLPVLKDRVNRVKVEGQVKRVGDYQWREGMRVSDLVREAEGLAEEEVYTQRATVYRLREDNSIEMLSFDLGKALSGDADQDIALRPKDRLVIYSLHEASFLDRTVQISGAVTRPGVYERSAGMTLKDLIVQAGGALPEAADAVEVARPSVEPGKTDLRSVSLAKVMRGESPDNLVLEDRDHVSVRTTRSVARSAKTVTILGEVAFPGKYALESDNERLSRLIERAGGLSPEAFPEGTVFSRSVPFVLPSSQTEIASSVEKSARALSRQIYELEMAKYGVSVPTPTAEPIPTPPAEGEAAKISAVTEMAEAATTAAASAAKRGAAPAVIRAREVSEVVKTSRLPVDLRTVMTKPGSEADLVLQDGDWITIPRRPVVVSVAGAVVSPSLVFFKEGKDIEYYVGQCGGYARDADRRQTVVIHPNGRVLSRREVSTIELGDIVVVPTKALSAPRDKWERWSEVLRAIGSVAVTAYVLGN